LKKLKKKRVFSTIMPKRIDLKEARAFLGGI
jgi:hypothetical protein